MKKTGTALMCALVVSGCATKPPGTPGAGYGETYTPVIDMQGVDMPQYYRDLTDCRRYAGIIDRDSAAISGAIGGAIVGGVIAAILGGDSRTIGDTASVGGFAGLSAQDAKAAGKQERIMANCMSSRGYRVLDSGMVMPAAAPPPQPAPAAAVAPPVVPHQGPSYKAMAEDIAASQACAAKPAAYMMSKGGWMEGYRVACTNGSTINIRCENGACRATD